MLCEAQLMKGIRLNNIEDRLKLAHLYQLDDLKVACERKLVYNLNNENAIDILLLSDKFKLVNIHAVFDFIIHQANDIFSRNNDWIEKLKGHDNLMMALIRCLAANV